MLLSSLKLPREHSALPFRFAFTRSHYAFDLEHLTTLSIEPPQNPWVLAGQLKRQNENYRETNYLSATFLNGAYLNKLTR